jgi:hypothetical protein
VPVGQSATLLLCWTDCSNFPVRWTLRLSPLGRRWTLSLQQHSSRDLFCFANPLRCHHTVLLSCGVACRPNQTLFRCLASSWNGDIRMWPSSTWHFEVTFLNIHDVCWNSGYRSSMQALCLGFILLYTIIICVYLSMFRGLFTSIFKVKDCRYVVHDLQITRCHASENKFHIHWIRFAHLRYKQPLFYCPLCYAFFALTPLTSLYHFLSGAVSFSV